MSMKRYFDNFDVLNAYYKMISIEAYNMSEIVSKKKDMVFFTDFPYSYPACRSCIS